MGGNLEQDVGRGRQHERTEGSAPHLAEVLIPHDLDLIDLPEPSAAQVSDQLFIDRVVQKVVANTQTGARLGRNGAQILAGRGGGAEGLFDEHINTGRGDERRGDVMGLRRRQYVHDIEILGGQHRLQRPVDVRDTERSGRLVGQGPVHVADGDDVGVRHPTDRRDVVLGDVARAEDGDRSNGGGHGEISLFVERHWSSGSPTCTR